ncbi:MAG: DUF1523 family protein [Rhodobacteraceae bacterium]|nr:DUF1523 family protein [Paracoccaceae bacterium]
MRALNWKKLAGIKALVLILVHGLVFSYVLPRVNVVKVVDTEIKRVDIQNQDGTITTTDVYQIQTTLARNDKPRVYRNEDNWIYLKLNSADLQTVAANAARNDATVALTSYGWRLQLFSMFPNVIAIKEVGVDYRHVPVFNILFLIAYFGGLGYLIMRVSRAVSGARERQEQRAEEHRINGETAERKAARHREANAAQARDNQKKRESDIDDFLNS